HVHEKDVRRPGEFSDVILLYGWLGIAYRHNMTFVILWQAENLLDLKRRHTAALNKALILPT
ncbi:MAG TPA: hypothetical protein PLU80_21985, partial [Acidobacteriota bacterium]|nr:hypothetical protein [Acidobacteriota bacterium]